MTDSAPGGGSGIGMALPTEERSSLGEGVNRMEITTAI